MPDPAFPDGISAGDTSQTSTILWARSGTPADLTFTVSASSDFSSPLPPVTVHVTDPTVPAKVEIDDLTPGTIYYYRVADAAGAAEVGHFQTAAAAGTHGGFHLGVSGDWRGELAPYPSISNAADANLNVFVKLGDTIYADFPSPALPKAQAQTLDNFRLKQAEVYGASAGVNTWADLQRSTSVLSIIDDHEVTNDFAGGAPTASDPRFAGSQAALINQTDLYKSGLQAFEEYNAIRNTTYAPGSVEPQDAARFGGVPDLYRFNTYGSDAAVFVTDARSFRDAELTPPSLTNPLDVGRFLLQSFDPSRTLLGHTQLDELKHDLLGAQQAGITWKFVMLPEPIQNFGPVDAQDRYEGYAAERNNLLHFINEDGIQNVVFVTADLHGTAVNNLTYQDVPVGPQIATSAFEVITGPVAFDAPLGPSIVKGAAEAGLLTPAQLAVYNALPVANDADSIGNDKDDFVKSLVNKELSVFGYDPLGLDSNLPQAQGLIKATLLQGDYVATHTYGWTEFDVDPVTQKLLVTTWGIPAYSTGNLPTDASNQPTPQVVSQFSVDPQALTQAPDPTHALGRAPGTAGGQSWVAALEAGTSLHDVTQGILNSPESQSQLNTSSNAGFVDQLYETVLGRQGDAAGVAAWAAALDSGTSRADVAVAIAESTEAHQHLASQIEQGWHLVA